MELPFRSSGRVPITFGAGEESERTANQSTPKHATIRSADARRNLRFIRIGVVVLWGSYLFGYCENVECSNRGCNLSCRAARIRVQIVLLPPWLFRRSSRRERFDKLPVSYTHLRA